ncbi:MAG: glycoside hydrolase family 3 C-terminal domain-containing protein [Ethanoligenens sp.]
MVTIDEVLIDGLLKQLTLEEKIGMIHSAGLFRTEGVSRLDIPPVKMSDGPMGVRREFADDAWTAVGSTDDYVTYLPANSALAATWNRELAHRIGHTLGEEARGRGKDVILSPGINIQRSPLCGRNFEYMSEDPRLIEEMVVPLIQGIQENDVAACVKHFAANSQETDRFMVDSVVSERVLREIYYPGFKAAVQKGCVLSLMGAYNRLNGEHCSHSKSLLDTVLRKEWGFDGVVVSDWGAVHSTKEAAESSLDIEMGCDSHFDENYLSKPLAEAIQKGEISTADVDKKIRDILRMMLHLKMIGPEKNLRKPGTYNTPEHRNAALAAARESVVLLKNEKSRLPLSQKNLKKLLVIGQNAEAIHSNGGGSAEIKALYEISPLMGLKTRLGGNVEIRYAKGYCIPEKEPEGSEGITAGQQEMDAKQSRTLLEEAVGLAKEYDEVILIGGLNHDYDLEALDRADLTLPYQQDDLIEAVLDANPNTVVVLVGGSPVDMSRWAHRAKAIVWGWYAGMESGGALADVLLGGTNPSGRLPVTFPKALSDSPAHRLGEFGKEGRVAYNEGVYVGYRFFDTYDVEPEFCFGHGLSYTTFDYQKIELETQKPATSSAFSIEVRVTVKNSGSRAGMETVQVYVKDTDACVTRPVHELKGFQKVFLEPEEKKTVTITLTKDAFGFYSEEKQCFLVEPGEFVIQAGSSSRDIRLTKSLQLDGSYSYQ